MEHRQTHLTQTYARLLIDCRSALIAALALAPLIALPTLARATLPEIPQGVSVLNTIGDKGLRDGILGNSDVAMISIFEGWADIQPDASSFDFTNLDDTITTIEAYPDKSILLRLPSMGGSQANLGNTPDWVFWAMGVDPLPTDATPGTTYSFTDSNLLKRCIPVFWQPVYLAKKKALIAMAGAHFANDSAIKIVGISYANAISEDWNVPNDDTVSPSEVELWLNPPDDPLVPGAGYTTQKVIDAAIHQADASFTDGVITGGTTLTSLSATFTQADIGCLVTGRGYRANTHIIAWISPTQVSLDQRASRKKAANFTIVARRDGLIDVAMAAFPNQYISGAVGGNGPELDFDYGNAHGEDPGTCLAETVDNLAQQLYPGRYIVQRNNVSATIPTKEEQDGSTAWILLSEAADAGIPTAGQALGPCWSNAEFPDYRMNGGNNCDHDNPDCTPTDNMCEGDCALDFLHILERSADKIATYSARYYEIYPPDASNLKDGVTYIHNLLNPPDRPKSRRLEHH